jgi:hypothetical protein
MKAKTATTDSLSLQRKKAMIAKRNRKVMSESKKKRMQLAKVMH